MVRHAVFRTRLMAAGLTLGSLAGCGTSPAGTEPLEPLQSLPRDLSAAEAELIRSSNEFGLPLFRRLAADRNGENVIASPLSAYFALGMALNGAAGTTRTAMEDVLDLSGLSEEEANAAFQSLIELLLELDDSVEFRIANSVWIRDGFPAGETFLQTTGDYFDARVEELDFDDPEAPSTINGWVEESTNGKIEELIESIDPAEVMFLINAIYFNGDWREPFDPELTQTADFRLADGSTVDVPMMSAEGRYLYQATELFQAVDLRYGRTAYSMTVLVPADGRGLDDVIAELDAESWDAWMEGFSETRIALGLPRFRLTWGKTLNDALEAMGMEVAFAPFEADFGRLVDPEAVLPGNLYLTEVKQKTFIDVNEEGTEAAAATSVGVGVTSVPPTFRADRPFLFAIRERFSGTVLFIGAVEDPTADVD